LREFDSVLPDLHKFTLFKTAQSIGIKFSPQDLAVDDVMIFAIITNKINELEGKKKNGK
jgi:hypothetical protein